MEKTEADIIMKRINILEQCVSEVYKEMIEDGASISDDLREEQVIIEHNVSQARKLYELSPVRFAQKYREILGMSTIEVVVNVLARPEREVTT